MPAFLVGHAVHPDWQRALALAAVQIDAAAAAAPARSAAPTLGFVYHTDHHGAHAPALLEALQRRWPGVAWVGCVGIGVAAGGVEYFDEPGLVLMLADLPPGSFELFSGRRQLRRGGAFSALVHADPATPDLSDLVAELADRTESGYLFGGLASARGPCRHIADGLWEGGLSGVAFSREVALVSRVTQGCQPLAAPRTVTACEGPLVLQLEDRPALACLLQDLGLADAQALRTQLPRLQSTLVGLTDAADSALGRGGQFGAATRVRHLIGVDPARGAVAVGDRLRTGMRLAFCRRDREAARRDLVRICSEIRDELESAVPPPAVAAGAAPSDPAAAMPAAPAVRGAIYVSCAGRGGPHFGGPSAELKIVQHALGDVPLVGFFASGEIARHHLYGYTGVLTVFTGA